MANTVVGLYRSRAEVREVVDELTDHGFARTKINIQERADDSVGRWLEDQGVPPAEADEYLEGLRQGGALVTVDAPEDRTPEAVEIMRRHEHDFDDLDDATTVPVTERAETATAGAATRVDDQEVVEVAEEELEVGKRQVERGGARIRTYVTERPVEESVTLRDEEVEVERRPVNRPASAAEAEDAFRERTIEVSETDEEAVVAKRPRVIEEVVISKDVEERTETVSDTVRRTDVEVEGGSDRSVAYDYDADEDYFREHHRANYVDSDYAYDDYAPAYRYGTALATHPTYRGRDWTEVEPDARERWEARNAGTWTDFRDAVRYGYDRAGTRR